MVISISVYSIHLIAADTYRIHPKIFVTFDCTSSSSFGCGEEVGKGGRYAVTKDAHINIIAEEGFYLYDDKSKQVIIKFNRELQGKTVDLKLYY